LKSSPDFGVAWGGIASVQLGLPAVWTGARARGHSLVDVVRWMASGPASLVGLSDRGRIAVGMQADLVRMLRLPVVLVVGLRLGCLNHALLSARAIAQDGLHLAGWIASHVDPAMEQVEDNLAMLRERMPASCWGVLPHAAHPDPVRLASLLRIPVLAE
jgi:hypothetical protein